MLYSRNIVKNSSENGQQINYRPGYYSSIYGRGGQPAARDIPQCGPQSLKMRMSNSTVESQNYDHIANNNLDPIV